MRPFLLLIIACLSFAQAAPGIQKMMDDNSAAALLLDNYNLTNGSNGTLTIHMGPVSREIGINVTVIPAGMNVMVDNMTSPVQGLSLITARGYQLGHLISLPSSGYPDFVCDDNWFQHMTSETAWRCDFDSDTCAEYEKSAIVRYDLNATFSFGNASETVAMGANTVNVPDIILQAMENSSGTDLLNVSIHGNATAIYTINDRVASFGCGDNLTNYSVGIPISANASYLVAGTRKLFFLRSPVLLEQWYADNRFDVIVLSQSPLYYGQVGQNGNQTRNFTLRNFTEVTDAYGLSRLESERIPQASVSEYRNLTRPAPLESFPNSFSYVYEFNHSYWGLGMNTLSLSVNDSFLGTGNMSENISSRMLSFNGSYSERGAPKAVEPARDSGSFSVESIGHLQIGLGLVAFVLILAFVNFWVIR